MTPQKQILVVEDNAINRAMLCDILAPEYTVLEAENGQVALSVLEEHKGEISLILLDITMPVMDGYTFLSIMKADPSLAAIPVIVTTLSDTESDEVAALSHGATDFVAKPYRPQIILHRVASIINLRETAAMINQFQYDRLTGLYSKEFFQQRVRDILIKNPDREFDIVCSDIENFKLINDIFGVPAGDRLLCSVADMHRSMVGETGICGRFNADQFACLVERRHDYSDELFIEAEARLNALSNVKSVVFKWGIFEIRDRDVSVEQMCDRAFLAVHSIKGQYSKHYAYYDEHLRNKLLREQAITDSMESALAEEQFVIYLQPKYSTKDDHLAGAEALVRWNHPEWGFMSPAEFIPLFERNGFITKLDQFVWEKACAALRDWREAGYPTVPVSINVSRADVYQADLADILMKLMRKYDLPPALLHLEITESAYTEDPEQIIETVKNLRELGFVIEMDDFGTGYSSLNMLNKMPLDVLKLDMKFIQTETAKPAEQGILRFIMGLARWMNLSVVAEGVETKEQLERLREIGCDYVQGYYFAKPMARQAFEGLLADGNGAAKAPQEGERPLAPQQEMLLIVDEDPDYRERMRGRFEYDYQVVEVGCAQDAIALIEGHKHDIALVLLSLSMAGSDGFAVLEALQREKAVWKIPVIATGPADGQLEERALELGADDYAFKPHTAKTLWRKVIRAVGLTSYRERENTLRDEACRDYLTGLLNRRGLNAAMDDLRREDIPLAVYLFDLDNLKQVNDQYGHAKGDQMIKAFGGLLNAYADRADILSRFGGDEFVVIIKQVGTEAEALQRGEAICRAFRQWQFAGHGAATCSAGIAVCTRGDVSMAELISRADTALYDAKSDNKGGCCLWKG